MGAFDNKYPYTDFHELNLDWFLAEFKKVYDHVDQLQTGFDNLTETVNNFIAFVNSYFDNLDVQEEVNKKLMQMANDGTLSILIQPLFDEYKADINLLVENQANAITEQGNQISLLNTRVDSIIALEDGSTTGDAELADIRIGANGITYATAGDAVRGQYEQLVDDIDEWNGFRNDVNTELGAVYSKNICDMDAITDHKKLNNDGTITDDNGYCVSALMKVSQGDTIYYTKNNNGTFQNKNTVNFIKIVFYDIYGAVSSDGHQDFANSVAVSGADTVAFRVSWTTTNIQNNAVLSITLNEYPTSLAEMENYHAPYYTLAQRVTALENNADNIVLDLTTVDCWGDSMTERGSAGETYPNLLQAILPAGFTCNNYGIGSQTSGEIAFRYGSNEIYVKLENDEIPASGSVNVEGIICSSGEKFGFKNFGNFSANKGCHCVINGVPGLLDCVIGGSKTFTRDASGSAVATYGYTKAYNDENYTDEHINIIWSGKNDTTSAATYIVKGTVDNVYKMTGILQHKMFIILPVFKSTNNIRGTTTYNNITAINAELAKLYPENYLDIQAMLIDHGLDDAHIVPTPEDEQAILDDVIPPSLMAADGFHPNETCRTVYVQYIKDFMINKGWITA